MTTIVDTFTEALAESTGALGPDRTPWPVRAAFAAGVLGGAGVRGVVPGGAVEGARGREMRLSDLNPRWFSEAGRHGQGVTFDCPHCAGGVRLSAPFTVPIDGGAPISLDHAVLWPTLQPRPDDAPGRVTVPPGVHWTREGATFDDLTLTPSIDASRSGHWHGWLRNGEVAGA